MDAPKRIGRYHVIEHLGSGGCAEVWLATDPELDDVVVVKMLIAGHASHPDLRRRFIKEAQHLRHVRSERVVTVHDIGEHDDGRPYFVMAYANGGTLDQRLTDEPLDLTAAISLMIEIARGITDLHQHDVIHRDVKPSNILFLSVGGTERVWIGDLGLARHAAQSGPLTIVGGTPPYMAPEQAAGMGLTTATDVYSLAVLAYRLITGQFPTDARTVAEVPRSANDTIIALGELEPGGTRQPQQDNHAGTGRGPTAAIPISRGIHRRPNRKPDRTEPHLTAQRCRGRRQCGPIRRHAT
jgi:serine/threonine protein kinase